jgi:hypothetical protein
MASTPKEKDVEVEQQKQATDQSPAQGSGAAAAEDGSLPGVEMRDHPEQPDTVPPTGKMWLQVPPGESVP